MEMASPHSWRWLRGKRAARQQNTDTDYLNPKDESVQSCEKIRKTKQTRAKDQYAKIVTSSSFTFSISCVLDLRAILGEG